MGLLLTKYLRGRLGMQKERAVHGRDDEEEEGNFKGTLDAVDVAEKAAHLLCY